MKGERVFQIDAPQIEDRERSSRNSLPAGQRMEHYILVILE
jgi:hypothetical protein